MVKSLTYDAPSIPDAPKAITKGSSLANLLGEQALAYLARNLKLTEPTFDEKTFQHRAIDGLDKLSLVNRGRHIAKALHHSLPFRFEENAQLLIRSLTKELTQTDNMGLSGFFYLPHTSYIAEFGRAAEFNDGHDPFDIAMLAQYEITKRFSAEFSIRYFLRDQQDRTLETLFSWMNDTNPHVRRLCSEGTRPRLPWGIKLHQFDQQPLLIMPILQKLKDDDSLYVRRSVANNLGDISKANPELVFDLCEDWLPNATKELKWLIRHAVRYHAKRKHPQALAIRQRAK